MIQMRMGQHHRSDIGGRDQRWRPVAQAKRLVTLEQAAIHENAMIFPLQQVFGAGHRAGPA